MKSGSILAALFLGTVFPPSLFPSPPAGPHEDPPSQAPLETRILSFPDLLLPCTPPPAVRFFPILGDGFADGPVLDILSNGSEDEESSEGPFYIFPSPEDPILIPDEVGKMLRPFVGAQELKGKDRDFQVFGGNLLLVQPARVIEKAEAGLTFLSRLLRPRLSIRLAVFLDPAPASGRAVRTIPFRDGEALLRSLEKGEGGRLLFQAEREAAAFQPVFLGRTRRFSFLGDLELEVAAKTSAARPLEKTLSLRQGVLLSSRPSPLGEELELACHALYQEPAGAPRGLSLHTGNPRMTMETAEFLDFQTGITLGLRENLALLLAPGGWQRPHLKFLLLVQRLSPPPQGEENVLFLSRDFFTPPGDSLPPADPDFNEMGWQYIKALIPKDLACEEFPRWIRISAPKADLASLRSRVERALAPFRRTFLVEIQREIAPVAPMGEGDRRWRPLGPPTAVLCRKGKPALALLGREKSYVAGYEVEIAEKSAAADPTVKTAFSGSLLLVRVDPQGEKTWVELNLLESSLLGFRRLPSAEITRIGTAFVPDLGQVHIQQSFSMKPGESRPLGWGPKRILRGRLYKTRLTLTLHIL